MTVTVAKLIAMRDAGLSQRAAIAQLGIALHTLHGLMRKHGIRWPTRCSGGHPPDDKIHVNGQNRCRLCYLARRKQPEPGAPKAAKPVPVAVAEALSARETLDRAIAMETAPPWLRHPQPYDPRDVVYRSAP